MSFGRPPSIGETFRLAPPQRGSFPLDHDGDCKIQMKDYLACLKSNKQDNGKCRALSRKYLECRMDNNLMDRDSMSNLGLGDALPTSSSDTPGAVVVEVKPETIPARVGDQGTVREERREAKSWLKV